LSRPLTLPKYFHYNITYYNLLKHTRKRIHLLNQTEKKLLLLKYFFEKKLQILFSGGVPILIEFNIFLFNNLNNKLKGIKINLKESKRDKIVNVIA